MEKEERRKGYLLTIGLLNMMLTPLSLLGHTCVWWRWDRKFLPHTI